MKTYLFVFFIFLVFFLPAQEHLDNEAHLKTLSDKCAEYYRKTDGEREGYRIKIHFGTDNAVAHDVKQKFSSKFNDVPVYIEYRQPNFVTVVGDFKTRLEAYEIFKKIQPDFPNAFIIKSKIKPQK